MSSFKKTRLATAFFSLAVSYLGYAAHVEIVNDTSFEIKVQHLLKNNRRWLEQETYVMPAHSRSHFDVPSDHEARFSFKNLSPYSVEAKEELTRELTTGMTLAATAAVAMGSVMPLLGPAVGMAGAFAVGIKCYYDSTYAVKSTIECLDDKDLEDDNIEYVITLKPRNLRSFMVEKRRLKIAST